MELVRASPLRKGSRLSELRTEPPGGRTRVAWLSSALHVDKGAWRREKGVIACVRGALSGEWSVYAGVQSVFARVWSAFARV